MHIVVWLSQNYIVRNKIKWNTFDKIDELIKYWAKEFFIWYVPNYWYEKFWFEISPNGRQSAQAQITTFEDFQNIVQYIKSKWAEALVTLNANSYNISVWNIIKQLIKDSDKAWVDWIIVSDLWILEYLKSINYTKKINVSTIFNIYNSETIKFLRDNYTINRYILPREVTIKEIIKITSEFPELKFEVFWSWDKCIWNNWNCFTEHNTKWGTDQFSNTVSGNPHSYCQFIEKVYKPRKILNYNFKNIILNPDISNTDKLKLLENKEIDDLNGVWNYLLSNIGAITTTYLKSKYNWFKNKSICVYDNSLSENSEYNKNIIKFTRGFQMSYLLLKDLFSKKEQEELEEFINRLTSEIKNWQLFYKQRIEEMGVDYIKLVDTLEWNRNWFESIKIFKNIPNIEALKIPARWKDIKHIIEYITWTSSWEHYSKTNYLDKTLDNSTGKFDYYNRLDNKFI